MLMLSSIVLSSRKQIIGIFIPNNQNKWFSLWQCNSLLEVCQNNLLPTAVMLICDDYLCHHCLVSLHQDALARELSFLAVLWTGATRLTSYITALCTLNMVCWGNVTAFISTNQSVPEKTVDTQVTKLVRKEVGLMTKVLKRMEMITATVALMQQKNHMRRLRMKHLLPRLFTLMVVEKCNYLSISAITISFMNMSVSTC